MESLKEPSLTDKVDELYNLMKENPKQMKKNLKLPRKARVKKRKIKQGWVGVIKVDENGNATGEKVKVQGSAFDTTDGSYHASDGREILFWDGKFPFYIQPTWKKNPIQIRSENEKNETYGQNYIQALMLNDHLDGKKKKSFGGNPLIWIVIAAVIGFIIYNISQKGGV
jgi:hypothetical protein